MYRVGDWIMYGNVGACRVVEITTVNSAWIGVDELCYVLEPLSQNYTISTPVSNRKVFTRPIISKLEAERLVDGIPAHQARAYYSDKVQELTHHYRAQLTTHDCSDLMELTMSLYAKKQRHGEDKGRFGSIDQTFMERAEDLLFGELSVALGIPRTDVPGYIASRADGQRCPEEEG
jgi:CarD family transcriptional regulator